MSSSAFAGNVLLIDLRELQQRGWLTTEEIAAAAGPDDARIDFAAMVPYRMQRLALAATRFAQRSSAAERAALAAFEQQHADWLGDYALFMALAEHHGWRDWCEWPDGWPRASRPRCSARAKRIASASPSGFCQWCFFRQWAALRAHAHSRGVQIVGDMPIFVAYQSADVWARPRLFELDAGGRPTVVAGVPPDAFSATGQRWGNPLYRWSEHAGTATPGGWSACGAARAGRHRAHRPLPRVRGALGDSAGEPTAQKGAWVGAPARRCSAPLPTRWARCPSSPKTWA